MWVDRVSTRLEKYLTGYLRKNGVTPTHVVSPAPAGDDSRIITLQWEVMDGLTAVANITFELTLELLTEGLGQRFCTLIVLSRATSTHTKTVRLELPSILDDAHAQGALVSQSEAALATLATELSDTDNPTL